METENIEFELPFFGKITGEQIEQFLPVYLRLRKDRDLKSLVPKDIDEKIMAFAALNGLVDPDPQRLEDLDIPLSELNESIDIMLSEGWSLTQIAKTLDIYPTVVSKRVAQNKETVSETIESDSEKVAKMSRQVEDLIATMKETEAILPQKTGIIATIKQKLSR